MCREDSGCRGSRKAAESGWERAVAVAGCREPEEGGDRRPVEREASLRRREEAAVGAGALGDWRPACGIERGKPGRCGMRFQGRC